MSIEFPCSQCGKLLRVGDDAAGKQARCPSCGVVQAIPATTPAPPLPLGTNPFGTASAPTSAPRPDDNPYQAPVSTPWHEVPQGAVQATSIDAGDVINRAWAIFTADFWTMALVGFVFWISSAALSFVVAQVMNVVMFAAGQGGQPEPALIFGTQFVLQIVNFLFGTWLEAGMAIYMLKTARGETTSVADIFSGGPYWPAAAAARFLYYLGVFVGSILLIIPGIIIALMFSQYLYLIIDRKQGALEALGSSNTFTAGNKLQLFLLLLAAFGVGLVGMLLCCVGIFPALAFLELMWAVAYLAITGQPIFDPTLRRQQATPFAPPPTGELR